MNKLPLFAVPIPACSARRTDYSIAFHLLLVAIAFLLLFPAASAQAAPRITAVGGFTISGYVNNALWSGQPAEAPNLGKYYGFHVIETRPANDVDPYWRLSGSGFTRNKGSVWLLNASDWSTVSGVSVVIDHWSDTEIRVRPLAPTSFNTKKLVLVVSLLKTKPPGPQSSPNWAHHNMDVIGMIRSRGYGQCTFGVAQHRLENGKTIPPSAYATTAAIEAAGAFSTYEPQRHDALVYGTRHVAVISTTPARTVNADGSLNYTFSVREMNAYWEEDWTVSHRSFRLSAPDASGRRKVLSGIGSNAGRSYIATGYYR